MLGVDAVDSMLFGGNAAGREATFNSPDVTNNRYRRYDYAFEPAALAKAAGRAHSFARPPRRLRKKPQWDWVLPHCDEKDTWLNEIRTAMVGLPEQTKWLVHGYERCGVADIKRPMLEMLREGLNHHDRIPHALHAPPLSAWVKHIVQHYAKLPELLFFAPAVVPASSSIFKPRTIGRAIASTPDFAIWGSHVVEMPEALHTDFCAKLWPFAAKARRRQCPERVVTMADAVVMVSRRHIQDVPLATWKALLALVATPTSGATVAHAEEQLLAYGWHMLFGQPAVLGHRTILRH